MRDPMKTLSVLTALIGLNAGYEEQGLHKPHQPIETETAFLDPQEQIKQEISCVLNQVYEQNLEQVTGGKLIVHLPKSQSYYFLETAIDHQRLTGILLAWFKEKSQNKFATYWPLVKQTLNKTLQIGEIGGLLDTKLHKAKILHILDKIYEKHIEPNNDTFTIRKPNIQNTIFTSTLDETQKKRYTNNSPTIV